MTDSMVTPHDGAQAVLDAIRVSITQLLSSVARSASAVRVSIGDVTVEVQWADPLARPARDSGMPAGEEIPQQTVFTGELPKSCGAAITAPTVGVFYRGPEPGAPPFAEVGDVVAAGQQVAIIEAMKIMIPVEAGRPGRIEEVLKADAEQVEFGEALFIVAPLG